MRRGYVDTRLGQIHYTTWGNQSKPVIVLLTQSSTSAVMYQNLSADLESDFFLVCPEYPGSGWSDPLPAEITFEEISEVLLEALDNLNIGQFAVYGHHTGNKIAALIAANHPDRANRLIFVGQTHSIVISNKERSTTMGRFRKPMLASADKRTTALLQWADMFNRASTRWWEDKTVRNITDDNLRALISRKVGDELMAGLSMPALYRANYALDLEAALLRVSVPTLVIEIASPTEDMWYGRQGEKTARGMQNARAVLLLEPDWHGNTMEHRGVDLANLVRNFLK